jgi:hypothetical protein
MSRLTYAIPFPTENARRKCNKRLTGGGKEYPFEDLIFEVNDGVEDGLRTILFKVGDNRPCAILYFDSTEEAILQVFERGVTCAVGRDTRVMLLAIRKYLQDNGVKRILFTDSSTYTCPDKTVVNLRLTYLFCYGKTWYDDVIGAEPLDPEPKQQYKSIQKKLKTLKWNSVRNLLNPSISTHSEILEMIPKQNVLFQELLNYLRTNIECKKFSIWLNIFASLVLPGQTFEGIVFVSHISSG